MFKLSPDQSFHYELLRVLAGATYQACDISEVLAVTNYINPGDIEGFSSAFVNLANRTHDIAEGIDHSKYPVSARNARFREATYYRTADFYLHGKWDDARVADLWVKHRNAFDKAIALLPQPAERIELQAQGFSIPAIFYGCGQPGARPTMLVCNGYDGAQEEMYHAAVHGALERGINVISFEGPGQPTVRREQNMGFILDWERVVTPVVDYALSRKDVDPKALALMGYSFGGFLTPRAAAFEHRLTAVISIGGVFDFGKVILNHIGPEMEALWRSGNKDAVDEAVKKQLVSTETPTTVRWGIEQGLWSFNLPSPTDWVTETQKYTLDAVVDGIQCPVFVGDGESEHFFPGEAKQLAARLGDRATYHQFKNVDGAGDHCQVGATQLMNQVVFDWFHQLISKD
jgi:alpha/beta superfamily hydrolase